MASAATAAAAAGLVDLEKELACSICTETLYQPLTLLDCLHTFCGSCLKEWFGWQKQNADKELDQHRRHDAQRQHRRRRRARPYVFTCPSCRAVVRETRPNATVTTLLDMYLKANPAKDKPAAEKEEIRRHYTQGESVLPRAPVDESDDGGQDDNEVAAEEDEDRRLLEHVRAMSLQDVGITGSTPRHGDRPPRLEQRAQQRESLQAGTRATTAQPTTATRGSAAQLTSSLGHQSSLRSLLSNTYDSDEMKEEILRQIAEEGLLDDIDWDNIEDDQEEEISERIADAYRRRRRDRQHRRQTTGNNDQRTSSDVRRSGEQARSSRPSSEGGPAANAPGHSRRPASRPPTSRPHLLENSESRPRASHERRRSSSQSRDLRPPSSSETARRAARSATDLSDNPTTRNHRRRASHEQRSSTDPDGLSISQQWRQAGNARTHVDTTRAASVVLPAPVVQSPEGPIPQAISVSCDRCGKANIEKSLHYSCGLCGNGSSTYDLCTRCYRQGKGCLHWFGFGYAAWPRYERQGRPEGGSPHVLSSRRYVDFGSGLTLQRGVFCDICGSNANGCYWHCDSCNEGEWGFCDACVRTGRHCTHPLLPLSLVSDELRPLDVTCSCNECGKPIAPLTRRWHCPTCDNGDYDVHEACYAALADAGRLKTSSDGPDGRRRCPRGHRLQVVQSAEHVGGPPWRSVVEDVAGGWTVDDEHAEEHGPRRQWSWDEGDDVRQNNHPPSHQQKKHQQAHALWSWTPEEGVDDEVMFPKGAVISDVVDVNGDFFEGVYCRSRGFFPASYVRLL